MIMDNKSIINYKESVYQFSDGDNIRIVTTDVEIFFHVGDILNFLNFTKRRLKKLNEGDIYWVFDKSNYGIRTMYVNQVGLLDLFKQSGVGRTYITTLKTIMIPTIYKYQLNLTVEEACAMRKDKESKLLASNKKFEDRLKEMLADNHLFAKVIMESSDYMTLHKISEEYSISKRKIADILLKHNIIRDFKNTNTIVLTDDFEECNLVRYMKDYNYSLSYKTCWTRKGMLLIYDVLKSEGILPIVEEYLLTNL